MSARTIDTEVQRHLTMMEHIRARVAAAGAAVMGWRVNLCAGFDDYLLQFQRGPASVGNGPDYSLDAKRLARALSPRWYRLDRNYEGALEGLPSVRVVIHQAEPPPAQPQPVEL